jgi:hypothetical protein
VATSWRPRPRRPLAPDHAGDRQARGAHRQAYQPAHVHLPDPRADRARVRHAHRRAPEAAAASEPAAGLAPVVLALRADPRLEVAIQGKVGRHRRASPALPEPPAVSAAWVRAPRSRDHSRVRAARRAWRSWPRSASIPFLDRLELASELGPQTLEQGVPKISRSALVASCASLCSSGVHCVDHDDTCARSGVTTRSRTENRYRAGAQTHRPWPSFARQKHPPWCRCRARCSTASAVVSVRC